MINCLNKDMTKYYRSGSTYRKERFDYDNDIVPTYSAFRTYEGERRAIEKHKGGVQYEMVAIAVARGKITELDQILICLIATFSAGCVTSKMLRELIAMMGLNHNYSDAMIDSSIKRMYSYGLIDFSRFLTQGGSLTNLRLITLAPNGSRLAESLGVSHRFNYKAIMSATVYSIKSYAQMAQLVMGYLKHGLVDSFEVRPVIVVDADAGGIVRPSASMVLQGQQVYVEAPRRHDGWLEGICDKLRRYGLCFKGMTPTVILNTEDEEMSRELWEAIKERDYGLELIFTDDMLNFGDGFRYSLYNYNDNGERQYFEFIGQSEAA